MQVAKVNIEKETLLDPTSKSWQSASVQDVKLQATPLEMQPSNWIQGAFKGVTYGQVSAAKLRALHNGKLMAVKAEWAVSKPERSTEAPNEFADACAVIFPFVKNAPLISMGGENEWVNMWYWRADGLGPFSVTAAGLGTALRIDDGVVQSQGLYQDGHWHVAFVRPLNPDKPQDHVPLKPGTSWQISMAVWQGADQERGGLKSFGPNWIDIQLQT